MYTWINVKAIKKGTTEGKQENVFHWIDLQDEN